jgi:hypothetical protein
MRDVGADTHAFTDSEVLRWRTLTARPYGRGIRLGFADVNLFPAKRSRFNDHSLSG